MNYIEKIREIFKRNTEVVKTKTKNGELWESFVFTDGLVKELTTLLQESNKEAIEDMRIWCLTMKKAGGDLEHWVRVYGKTDKEIEEYLKTLDGGAEKNDTPKMSKETYDKLTKEGAVMCPWDLLSTATEHDKKIAIEAIRWTMHNLDNLAEVWATESIENLDRVNTSFLDFAYDKYISSRGDKGEQI